MKYQDIQYNAAQGAPYQLSKKVFKFKTDKETLAEYQKIVRGYYPNYTEGDIVSLFKQLEQERNRGI